MIPGTPIPPADPETPGKTPGQFVFSMGKVPNSTRKVKDSWNAWGWFRKAMGMAPRIRAEGKMIFFGGIHLIP